MRKTISLILAILFVCLAVISCSKTYESYNYDLDDYIELAEYKNLSATAAKKEVTDEEVDLMIQSSASYYSRIVDAGDRPIKAGDIIMCYYYGNAEGYSDEIIVQDHQIELGTNVYPEEFENALIGMEIGDFKTLDTVLPNNLEQYPDLGGKKATITIVINDIYEREYPELTDDFVRAYLKFDSLDDMKQSVREKLENTYQNGYYSIILSQAWNEILEKTTVKQYPEKEIKKYYDRVVAEVSDYVNGLELDFKEFVEYNFEMTEEEFYDYAMTSAQKYVKEEMIVEAIARKENITVSAEEYTERGEQLAINTYGLSSLEELEQRFSPEEIKLSILSDAVKLYVAENTVVSPESVS